MRFLTPYESITTQDTDDAFGITSATDLLNSLLDYYLK